MYCWPRSWRALRNSGAIFRKFLGTKGRKTSGSPLFPPVRQLLVAAPHPDRSCRHPVRLGVQSVDGSHVRRYPYDRLLPAASR